MRGAIAPRFILSLKVSEFFFALSAESRMSKKMMSWICLFAEALSDIILVIVIFDIQV